MSATIGINDLKFVIFASGHDYTLADSGDGDVQVFSHPYVPLNSVMYAGQWYFLVPDENGDAMDCVKDDIAHCEFTPALGDVFDTEGEVTVSCHYHREYIYAEETLVVDKTVSQKITVVNHGTVSNAAHWNSSIRENIRCDVYTDGYAFFRPMTTTEVGANVYTSDTNNVIRKTSSIPWRASSIGRQASPMLMGNSVVDISEFAFADVSNATLICLLGNTYVEDISALKEWNVSACTNMQRLFWYNSKLTDISALANWDVSSVTDLSFAFEGSNLSSLHGLENWDVSNVTDIRSVFTNNANLTDISALLKWDISNVTDLSNLVSSCAKLSNLHGLELWDVSSVTDYTAMLRNTKVLNLVPLTNWNAKPKTLYHFCANTSLKSLDGLENWDVSACTSMHSAFQDCWSLVDCDAISGWNTSACTDFGYMFSGCYWLPSIKAFENWVFRGSCNAMFYGASILTVDNVVLDLSRVTNYTQFLYATEKDYSSKLGKDLVYISYSWRDYEGHIYTIGEVDDAEHPLSVYQRDASNAENWTVNGTNLSAFNAERWNNIPSWN